MAVVVSPDVMALDRDDMSAFTLLDESESDFGPPGPRLIAVWMSFKVDKADEESPASISFFNSVIAFFIGLLSSELAAVELSLPPWACRVESNWLQTDEAVVVSPDFRALAKAVINLEMELELSELVAFSVVVVRFVNEEMEDIAWNWG